MNNFGVIEVASTKTTHAPGWAYVPDTVITSSAALQPTNRKRAARNQPNLSLSDVSARQETKIRKELEALDKDNQRDVNIPIPAKSGSRAQSKHTANVRRILQSQKTFANHLDDYEALLAQQPDNIPAAAPPKAVAPAPAGGASTAASTSGGSKRATAGHKKAQKTEDDAGDETAVPTGSSQPQPQPEPQLPQSYPRTSDILPIYNRPPPAPHPGDSDPLLVSYIPPPLPSDAELRALMTAPPLSYAAARADDRPDGDGRRRYPARTFCEVCGYWGLVRCGKCGGRVCALECLEVHREECVMRYGL